MNEAIPQFVDQKTLAAFLDVDVRSIRSWQKEATFPVLGKGFAKYPLQECVKWYLNHEVQIALSRNQKPTNLSLDELKAEGQAIKNEMEAWKLEALKKNLVSLSACEEKLERKVKPIIEQLDQIPSAWCQMVLGLSSQAEAKMVLAELRDRLKNNIANRTYDQPSEEEAIEEVEETDVEDSE